MHEYTGIVQLRARSLPVSLRTPIGVTHLMRLSGSFESIVHIVVGCKTFLVD
jgi:hypothetical protein